MKVRASHFQYGQSNSVSKSFIIYLHIVLMFTNSVSGITVSEIKTR